MKITKKFFSSKLFVLICIFFISTIICIFTHLPQNNGNSLSSQLEAHQRGRDRLNILSGMIYRHLIGYDLVCTDAGTPLLKYPDYFSQKYKDQINQVDLKWKAYRTSLEKVLTKFDSEIYPTISADIQNELIALERMVAQNILAQKTNIPVNQIQWTKQLEGRLNLKDACALLDDEAAFLLEHSSFDLEFKKLLKAHKD